MNNHSMITRSKIVNDDLCGQHILNNDDNNDDNDDIDEHGNIKGFIDYDAGDDPEALNEVRDYLYLISNGSNTYKPKKTSHSDHVVV